jgi:hypothetical protein
MAVASEDEHRWLAAEQGDPARGESGVHASVDAVIRSRWNEAKGVAPRCGRRTPPLATRPN